MDPLQLSSLSGEDIQREIEKVNHALRGLGNESYKTFTQLGFGSRQAFQSMGVDIQQYLVQMRQLITQMSENEAAQQLLHE